MVLNFSTCPQIWKCFRSSYGFYGFITEKTLPQGKQIVTVFASYCTKRRPELLVIVSCRNLGTKLNCVYESGGSTWNGFTAKETDSKPWISKGWHRSPLVQIKGHRHYSSAEMNTTIHSRHSTVSDWLRYPGFFLDHYFVSYVLGLFLSIIVSPVEEHQIWYDKHQQRNRTWQKRGSCHVSWGLDSFFLLSRM